MWLATFEWCECICKLFMYVPDDYWQARGKIFFPRIQESVRNNRNCIRTGPLITGTSIRQNKNSGICLEQSAIKWNLVDNQKLRRTGQQHRNKLRLRNVDRSRALKKSVAGTQKNWAATPDQMLTHERGQITNIEKISHFDIFSLPTSQSWSFPLAST